MALYKDVFEHDLSVKDIYLRQKEDLFRPRLRHAAKEFQSDHSHMAAINLCIHAASSIILSHAKNLQKALSRLRAAEKLRGKDATFLLTVSSLCCLIEWAATHALKEKTKGLMENPKELKENAKEREEYEEYNADLEQLRNAFADMNWLIGEDAVQALGLPGKSRLARKGEGSVGGIRR